MLSLIGGSGLGLRPAPFSLQSVCKRRLPLANSESTRGVIYQMCLISIFDPISQNLYLARLNVNRHCFSVQK